ncbi:MAG: SPASM domain-containing protein [Planctomycetaceae bacterium]|nr:SPASM domain-containing protein [Planctomycetaceae bacterium]
MGTHSRSSRHHLAPRDPDERRFFDEHGYTPAPRLVQWMATLRCPLSCGHCLAAGDHTMSDMPIETALRLVDEAADMGVGEFLVTGGEPLCRADLRPVLECLSQRRLPWSLNTAIMPVGELREAIETHPPRFAAVSLDGPKDVHDSFRGRGDSFEQALAAIRFFSGLGNCRVAAGTTVTTHNFAALGETFRLTVASGAHSWGIHLPVPQGRAAKRPDLFLSKKQLGDLMRFVARRRAYFPVTMADEIGYTGDWEPQLRDSPFRCGAGIAQCVVLPDGSVVPCTTLDTLTAAGNIHDRPLAEIWRDGFSALRHRQMEGRCTACKYAPACGGGCWLQRRSGTHCFRSVWHVGAALKTAAGMAVCMGVLHAAAADDPPKAPAQTRPAVKQLVKGVQEASAIEQAIVAWYAMPLGGYSYDRLPLADRSVPDALVSDPAGIFLAQYRQGLLPKDAPGLAQALDKAVQTPQRSLAFSALMWRALAEHCLADAAPQQRTPADRKALREAMAALEKTSLAWRSEIFEKKLDPYLARGRSGQIFQFMMSKAIRPGERELNAQNHLAKDTAIERWGGPQDEAKANATPPEPLEGYLERHPYAEAMRLEVAGSSRVNASRFSASGPARGAPSSMGIFDIIETGDDGAEMTVRDAVGKTAYTVKLPPKAELTYADLLGLVYRQNEPALDAAAKEHLKKFANRQLGQTAPLLLPAMLKTPPGQARAYEKQIWLADFWMF